MDRDSDVGGYLGDVAPGRREVLVAIRDACVAELGGFVDPHTGRGRL